jgi:CDP-diacylglycerol--serine O-phosphatidyltransferase
VVIATVLAIEGPLYGWAPLLPVAAGVLPAALMVTSFRFRSFRSLLSTDSLWVTGAIVVLVLLGLAIQPGPTGLVLAYGYVLTSPLGWITGPLRRRWLGPEWVAPPRTKLPSVFLPLAEDNDVECSDDDDFDGPGSGPCLDDPGAPGPAHPVQNEPTDHIDHTEHSEPRG